MRNVSEIATTISTTMTMRTESTSRPGVGRSSLRSSAAKSGARLRPHPAAGRDARHARSFIDHDYRRGAVAHQVVGSIR